MLNPSTADAENDDPTIKRCRNFAKAWGYSGVEVVNLYAYRATDPADLRRAAYPRAPVGLDDEVIREASRLHCKEGVVVAAWGAGAPHERAAEVLALIREAGATPHALALTQRGQPRHPLYLSAKLVPFEWGTA